MSKKNKTNSWFGNNDSFMIQESLEQYQNHRQHIQLAERQAAFQQQAAYDFEIKKIADKYPKEISELAADVVLLITKEQNSFKAFEQVCNLLMETKFNSKLEKLIND